MKSRVEPHHRAAVAVVVRRRGAEAYHHSLCAAEQPLLGVCVSDENYRASNLQLQHVVRGRTELCLDAPLQLTLLLLHCCIHCCRLAEAERVPRPVLHECPIDLRKPLLIILVRRLVLWEDLEDIFPEMVVLGRNKAREVVLGVGSTSKAVENILERWLRLSVVMSKLVMILRGNPFLPVSCLEAEPCFFLKFDRQELVKVADQYDLDASKGG
mmetsp:Transcript_1645/g.3857  ORF Transcript_1645/g.3857 Transcript_1645/m.3857 type:complete len:213 (+) Transcript_1645:122-760(+)